jgi:AcrR family transcriptional regulator
MVQRPDPDKRREIMKVAAKLFAERPFHEVRLDVIAAATHLGKGTIYVYFASKDDLHTTLIAEGLEQLTSDLRAASKTADAAWPLIERIVRALLDFADRFPHLYTLMRSGAPPKGTRLVQKRRQLSAEIARQLRLGNKRGELDDPQPALTAEFLLSFVRVALLFAPAGMQKRAIVRHILRVLGQGILAPSKRKSP